MKHLNNFNENKILTGPGKIHDELIDTLKKWLNHYTNDQVLEQILDLNLPIDYIYDQEAIKDEDIQLAIKLLRKIIY